MTLGESLSLSLALSSRSGSASLLAGRRRELARSVKVEPDLVELFDAGGADVALQLAVPPLLLDALLADPLGQAQGRWQGRGRRRRRRRPVPRGNVKAPAVFLSVGPDRLVALLPENVRLGDARFGGEVPFEADIVELLEHLVGERLPGFPGRVQEPIVPAHLLHPDAHGLAGHPSRGGDLAVPVLLPKLPALLQAIPEGVFLLPFLGSGLDGCFLPGLAAIGLLLDPPGSFLSRRDRRFLPGLAAIDLLLDSSGTFLHRWRSFSDLDTDLMLHRLGFFFAPFFFRASGSRSARRHRCFPKPVVSRRCRIFCVLGEIENNETVCDSNEEGR